MSDPEELSSCLAYKECGVSKRNVSLSMSPLARLIIPFSGEILVRAA
jgi:hypothetical protein